jgi:hypothetical protein
MVEMTDSLSATFHEAIKTARLGIDVRVLRQGSLKS